MSQWRWLTEYHYSRRFIMRVLLKTLGLFIAANLIFALTNPLPSLGHITIYNWLVPGRDRLPYWESAQSYNLGLNSLEAMFSSHRISLTKRPDEYRVVFIGDSSVWGVLLDNADTLTSNLNRAHIRIGNKTLSAYNIGHPVMSVTKDLMLLDYAMSYQPDLVVWPVTLEALPRQKQLDAPLAQNNPTRIRDLINRFDLNLNPNDSRFVDQDLWGKTIIGQRRALADWWRLQLYGIDWAATGIDQVNEPFKPRANDFDDDKTWQEFSPDTLFGAADIALDVLDAGQKITGQIPLLIINEPIFIANGHNSDIRYNFWYPRWAYDYYRDLMLKTAQREQWNYIDLWDRITSDDFTDSPVHLTANGSRQLSDIVGNVILDYVTQH